MHEIMAILKDQVICYLLAEYDTHCGHAVVQLLEALCYKPEGHWFDS
jgi:hypothetical protein